MPPIIRHTITITVTETWTILWPDGQETSWQATHEVAWPAVSEPTELQPPGLDDDESDDDVLAPAAADATSEDE